MKNPKLQSVEEKIEPTPTVTEILCKFFDLYKKGRKNGAPVNFIDFYEARSFLLEEIDKAKAEEKEKRFNLMALCSEAIGALSYHNEKSAKEYKERLNALDEAKVIISKLCV